MKPSLGKAIKFSLSDVYNNLGKVILINLFWTVCFVPSLLIGMQVRQNLSPFGILVLVISFLITAPALGGVFHLSKKIALNDPYLETKDFFRGVKEYWKKSLFLLILSLIVPTLSGSAVVFYGQIARAHPAGIILWVISLWAFIFFLLMQTYLFPLMVTQNMDLRKIIKTSLLLALNNFGFTLVIVILEIAFLALFSLTGIIFIGGVGTIALLQVNAFIELSKKYTGEEVKKERKREEPRTAKQFFRDIFQPWKYD